MTHKAIILTTKKSNQIIIENENTLNEIETFSHFNQDRIKKGMFCAVDVQLVLLLDGQRDKEIFHQENFKSQSLLVKLFRRSIIFFFILLREAKYLIAKWNIVNAIILKLLKLEIMNSSYYEVVNWKNLWDYFSTATFLNVWTFPVLYQI